MRARIMAHLVAGFPNQAASLAVASALVKGGASYLEIQFPFSDPSADGPAIQAACTEALAAGFKVAHGWELVDQLHERFPDVPIFVMSYASIVITRGIKAFVGDAAQHRVGLIIPDLVPGADDGLFAEGARRTVPIVPVIVPTVSPARLDEILALRPEWVYTAIRTGITGSHTTLTPELEAFLAQLNERSKVLAGFGIDSPGQVRALASKVHAPVIGSAFVRTVTDVLKAPYTTAADQMTEMARQLENQASSLVSA